MLVSGRISMDVYSFEDYRQYLAAAFAALKRARPGLSQRAFAALAGFANPGFLNDVLKGRRTLSDAAVEKMLRAFELRPHEAEYFRLLVAYGQSKKPAERQGLYDQMLFRRNRSSFVRLHPGVSKYYQDFHYPLLRAAIQVCDFRGDYEKLARFLRPPVALPVIKKCVRELCAWGLVRQERDGRYRVVFQNQEPPPSLGDLVKRLNREWVVQAADALFAFDKRERHISSSLLTVGEAMYAEIMRRLETFREEIFALAQQEENPDRVMQFSIQFFPRTHMPEAKPHA